MGIATKFAKWDVPALATLKGCKAYQLREQLNDGEKLSRADKNWLTEAINRNSYFRRGIPVMGSLLGEAVQANPRILCH